MTDKKAPDFDSIRQLNVYGQEYWSARDLMPLLGYGKNWRNFLTAIEKASDACRTNGQVITDHFVASIKLVPIGSGAKRETDDYLLSRLACYLIAMNGNLESQKLPLRRTTSLSLLVQTRYIYCAKSRRNVWQRDWR